MGGHGAGRSLRSRPTVSIGCSTASGAVSSYSSITQASHDQAVGSEPDENVVGDEEVLGTAVPTEAARRRWRPGLDTLLLGRHAGRDAGRDARSLGHGDDGLRRTRSRN